MGRSFSPTRLSLGQLPSTSSRGGFLLGGWPSLLRRPSDVSTRSGSPSLASLFSASLPRRVRLLALLHILAVSFFFTTRRYRIDPLEKLNEALRRYPEPHAFYHREGATSSRELATPPLAALEEAKPVGEVAMLTCWSGEWTETGRQSLKSKQEYADYWNYTLHVSVNEPMTGGKQGSWNKIFALRRIMREHPETEWFWVSDSDLVIMNPALSIEEHILAPLGVVPGQSTDEKSFFIIGIDCNCINAGSFLIRNNLYAYLFLDLLLDPLLHGLPYGEQDSMSHLLSHHPMLLAKTILVPLRMFNSYPPSSCPISEVAYQPANGKWLTEHNTKIRVIPGYEYGSLADIGWNEPNPLQNWTPTPKKVQVVNQFGEPIEVRDQTPEEIMEEYTARIKVEGREWDPLILRDGGKPPASPPGTKWSITREMTDEEREKVKWQWWNDKRLRHGRYHYMPGDFTIHLAGCWLVEGQCEATWAYYWSVRKSVASLPPRSGSRRLALSSSFGTKPEAEGQGSDRRRAADGEVVGRAG